MPEYYFDIETYSPGRVPNPDNDKIITIQFQKIDLRTGEPKGDLIILKEWESSEENIVKQFYNRFFKEKDIWYFIPVGFNLSFELEFLICKFNKFCNTHFTSRDMYYNRPNIDLKPIVVPLNNGKFKGSSLDKFTGKIHNGSKIKEWYENKQYDKIEEYIRNEADAYLEFLQNIIQHLREYNKKRI